jgi:hypothetical protein
MFSMKNSKSNYYTKSWRFRKGNPNKTTSPRTTQNGNGNHQGHQGHQEHQEQNRNRPKKTLHQHAGCFFMHLSILEFFLVLLVALVLLVILLL